MNGINLSLLNFEVTPYTIFTSGKTEPEEEIETDIDATLSNYQNQYEDNGYNWNEITEDGLEVTDLEYIMYNNNKYKQIELDIGFFDGYTYYDQYCEDEKIVSAQLIWTGNTTVSYTEYNVQCWLSSDEKVMVCVGGESDHNYDERIWVKAEYFETGDSTDYTIEKVKSYFNENDTEDDLEDTTSDDTESDEDNTIKTIRLGLLDVNFFRTEETVGNNGTTTSSSILGPIVSNVYKGLRNLCLVIMMLVLLYIGIRIILSTTAKDQSKYKTWLTDWIVGFCLLFVMHFIMSFLMGMNSVIVDMLSNEEGDSFYFGLYELEDNAEKVGTGNTGSSEWYAVATTSFRRISIDKQNYMKEHIVIFNGERRDGYLFD